MRTKLLIAIVCASLLGCLFAISKSTPIAAQSALPGSLSTGGQSSKGERFESSETASGQALIRHAAASLERLYTVSAHVTQKAQLFGNEVIGSGEYFEQRSNQGLLFRLEMKVQTRDDAKSSGLLHVCDGRYAWRYRKLRGAESLSRIDLAYVQQRIDQTGKSPATRILDSWPGMGGLSKLLRSFDKAFVFDEPELVPLQKDFPAWKVEGHWRPEMLIRAVPDQKEAIRQGRGVALGDLPEQLPNSVILFLGREDFFPYSIAFYRLEGTTADVRATRGDQPIVRINMSRVRFNLPVHAGQFVYKPSLAFTDRTEQLLEKLKIE